MTEARDTARTFAGLKAAGDVNRGISTKSSKWRWTRTPRSCRFGRCGSPTPSTARTRVFAGKAGTDSTGRYLTAWIRKDNTDAIVPCLNYDVPGTGDYYLVPKSTGKEDFREPYVHSYTGDKNDDEWVTTFSVPIRVNGAFAGVVGIDLAIRNLAGLTKDVKILDTGYLSVISNAGVRLVNPNPKTIGQVVGDDVPASKAALLAAIHDGNQYEIVQTQHFQRFDLVGQLRPGGGRRSGQPLVTGVNRPPRSAIGRSE